MEQQILTFGKIPRKVQFTTVYTDGSKKEYKSGPHTCTRTGLGIVIIGTDDQLTMISGGGESTDINICEAQAILRFLQNYDKNSCGSLKFVVDSKCIVDRLTEIDTGICINCGKKKKTCKHQPTSETSREIQKEVQKIADRCYARTGSISFVRVRSHTGVQNQLAHGNMLADNAARKGLELKPGSLLQWEVRKKE